MQYCFEQILQEFNTMFQTQAPQNIRHKRLKKCSKNGAESHAKTGRLKQSKISKLKHYPGASWLLRPKHKYLRAKWIDVILDVYAF